MHGYDEILSKINIALKTVSYKQNPAELYEPIRYSLEMGGKRLRPSLTLMACDLFGGKVDEALNAAVGLEIFHNFTLLHDDIMDQAPKRRNMETVYKKWNSNRAILSGDTMFAMAYQYVSSTDVHILPQVLKAFNQTAIEVCEGQQFDMNYESQLDVSIDEYLEMIRLKTAVLIAGSLQIGALIGGASNEEANQIYRYGEAIGMAFQLKDDLLDVYGDEQKFGKMPGGDIVENKKTFLYLKALEHADEIQQKALADLYNDVAIEAEIKVREVKAIFDQLTIREITQKAIDNYCIEGVTYLNGIDKTEENKAVLKEFSNRLMKRDS